MTSKDIFPIIQSHDIAKLEQWIAEGFDVNEILKHPPFCTPLQDAVDELDYAVDELDYNNSTEIVKKLLQAGANPNFQHAESFNSALMMAIAGEHNFVVKLLLDYRANPNFRNSEGDSPLRRSVYKDDLEMVKLLINYDLSVSINDPGGMSGMNALGIAISRLNLPMVKILIDADADPFCEDVDFRVAEDCIPSDADPEIQSQLRNYLLKK